MVLAEAIGEDAVSREPVVKSLQASGLSLMMICGSMAISVAETTVPRQNYDKDLLNLGVQFVSPPGWSKSVNDRLGGVDFFPPERAGIMSVGVRESTKEQFERDVATVQDEKETVTLGDVPGVLWLTEGMGGRVKRKTFLGFKEDKMYLIVFSANAGKFHQYLPVVDQALSTFALVNK